MAVELTAELDVLGPTGSPERREGCRVLHARLTELDPVAAGRIEPGNERRLVRALEVTLGSGRPFSSFGPGLERYPPSRVTLLGIARRPDDVDRRIAERFARLMDGGFLDEVRRLAARPAGLSRTARQALGYRELLAHVEDGVPLADAVDEAVRRTRAFARRQRPGSVGIPASSGSTRTTSRWPPWRPGWPPGGDVGARSRDPPPGTGGAAGTRRGRPDERL